MGLCKARTISTQITPQSKQAMILVACGPYVGLTAKLVWRAKRSYRTRKLLLPVF